MGGAGSACTMGVPSCATVGAAIARERDLRKTRRIAGRADLGESEVTEGITGSAHRMQLTRVTSDARAHASVRDRELPAHIDATTTAGTAYLTTAYRYQLTATR